MRGGKTHWQVAEVLLKRGWQGAIEAQDAKYVLVTAASLAEILMKEKRFDEAGVLLQQTIAIDAKQPSSETSARLHNEYSRLLWRQRKYEDSEREAKIAYELRSKLFGKPNLHTVNSLIRAIQAQWAMRHFADAEVTARLALREIQVIDPQGENAESPAIYDMVGRSALMNGRIEEGQEYGWKALQLYLKLLGPGNEGTYRCALWYAQQLKLAGREEEAIRFSAAIHRTPQQSDQPTQTELTEQTDE